MVYLIFVLLMFSVMILYFKIANHYNIIDKPNGRSSHTEVTIRGGGIIFVFAALCAGTLHPEFWMPLLGMFIISVISFIDDRITLSSKIRIVFHVAAATLLLLSLNVFHLFPWWGCVMLYILVIGIINAYNFMDGINGMTGLYSLVVLCGLQYVNYEIYKFIHPDLIWLPLLACIVFLFFNFRKVARCFAGDVGSVGLAFYIIYLLLSLIIRTGNYTYILFLSVYGVDTVFTIFHRLMLKQNILDAHRLHFYQILANDQKWSHLWVSCLYAVLQGIIIIVVLVAPIDFMWLFLISTFPFAIIYVLLKRRLMIIL